MKAALTKSVKCICCGFRISFGPYPDPCPPHQVTYKGKIRYICDRCNELIEVAELYYERLETQIEYIRREFDVESKDPMKEKEARREE
jgi:hypothetical protein